MKYWKDHRGVTRRAFNIGSAGLPLLLAGGCSLPGGGPAPRLIRLSAVEEFPPDLPFVNWPLLVDEPVATLYLDTSKIAIRRGDDVEYLADGEWASPAPEMVMELLAESFKNTGRIPTVGDRRSRIRPKYEIQSQLTAFYILENGSGATSVDVGLDVTLVRRPQRDSLASSPFHASTELKGLILDDIVRAFEKNLQNILAEAVAWTLTTGKRESQA